MLTEILVWLALGAVVGFGAGVLLVWVVRQVFSRFWLVWGLMDPADDPPAIHHSKAWWLDSRLRVSSAMCGSAIAGLVAYPNGLGLELVWSCSLFCGLVLIQARIDAQTGMLPDRLTLPTLWIGLLFSLFGGWVSLEHSVAGAAAGYIVMWVLVAVFRCVTGREAIGRGDFKLSAAIGAWLGIWTLPKVWLAASLWLCLIATWDHVRGRQKFRAPRPFGPGLALGGILAMLLQVN